MSTKRGSYVDKSSITAPSDETDKDKKRINFFLDLNPENMCLTLFDRGLIGACRDVKIILNKQTPQEVIDKELAKNLILDGKHNSFLKRHKPRWNCIKVVPRANPKGLVQICEMCPEQAVLRCVKCMVTYYCGWAHRHMDTAHSLSCPKLKILRSPGLHGVNAAFRNRLMAQKLTVRESLLENLVYQAHTNLYSRKLPLALSLLRQSLKYVKEVYGNDAGTLQLITIYTALAEVQLFMRKMAAAEKSINMAWFLLWRTEEKKDLNIPSNYAHAQVNKTQGLLLYAMGNMQDAVHHFSECVYHTSEGSSPTDVRACVGYYNLGKCFYAMSKKADGLYSLSFCLKLWLDFLGDVLTAIPTQRKSMWGLSQEVPLVSLYLEMEASEQLSGFLDYFNKESHPVEIFRIKLCQGILHFCNKKFAEAVRCIRGYDFKFQDEAEVMSIFKLLKKLAARREIHG